MIEFATPIPSLKMPKPTSPLAKLGLAYERKLVRALRESAPHGVYVESNPWYEYGDEAGTHICSPDIIIIDEGEGYGIVAEVKLNWTPLAIQKLSELYCPVMNCCHFAIGIPFKPLVITKNLTPESPRPQPRLTWAFNANVPLFHWPGLGSVLW